MDREMDSEAYTVSDIVRLTGISRAQLYRFIDGYEQAEAFRLSVDERNSGKYYSREQWDKLLTSIGHGFPEVSQEEVADGGESITKFSGLVKPRQGASMRRHGFDAQEYQQYRAELDDQTAEQAAAVDAAVTRYAQSRIAQTLADIDVAAAEMRSNAFKAMGMNPSEDQGS